MGQLKDLTGQKFGKLTVLRRVEDKQRGRPMWLCQCECGNQTVVSSTRLLLPNGTRSCGCLRHQPSGRLVDLTGRVFGHLTVLHGMNRSPEARQSGFADALAAILSLFFLTASDLEEPNHVAAAARRSNMI